MNNSHSATAIDVRDVTKIYKLGDIEVPALRGVSFTIAAGEYVAIMGPSGSGKSTLMNVLGCLDRPTAGRYVLGGTDVSTLDDNALALIRLKKLGFVFQGFNLLARTSALKNVALPLFYAGVPARVRNAAAATQLREVSLGDRLDHKPSELSGGQQQRVAIARALVNNPALILADEPTGNLDSRTSIDVMALFQELNDKGITIVLVTHEPDIALYSKRIVEMRDGFIIKDARITNRKNAAADLLALSGAGPIGQASDASQLSQALASPIVVSRMDRNDIA
jgi:putative ABC transport system ATP-binding protein